MSNNIRDEIVEAMSSEIAKELDFEIIADILIASCGWHKIWKTAESTGHALGMAKWCNEQCENRSRYRGSTWIFERAEDAALFRLTWGA
jgi:hypothetical protein